MYINFLKNKINMSLNCFIDFLALINYYIAYLASKIKLPIVRLALWMDISILFELERTNL